MIAAIAILISVVMTFSASLVAERVLGRSRKEMIKPGWYYVFGLATPVLACLVNFTVHADSPYLYGAYGLAGGAASLLAQCLYGVRIKDAQQ